jgi:hypothetical protein
MRLAHEKLQAEAAAAAEAAAEAAGAAAAAKGSKKPAGVVAASVSSHPVAEQPPTASAAPIASLLFPAVSLPGGTSPVTSVLTEIFAASLLDAIERSEVFLAAEHVRGCGSQSGASAAVPAHFDLDSALVRFPVSETSASLSDVSCPLLTRCELEAAVQALTESGRLEAVAARAVEAIARAATAVKTSTE